MQSAHDYVSGVVARNKKLFDNRDNTLKMGSEEFKKQLKLAFEAGFGSGYGAGFEAGKNQPSLFDKVFGPKS